MPEHRHRVRKRIKIRDQTSLAISQAQGLPGSGRICLDSQSLFGFWDPSVVLMEFVAGGIYGIIRP